MEERRNTTMAAKEWNTEEQRETQMENDRKRVER